MGKIVAVHIALPEPTSSQFVEGSAAYNQRSLPQYLHALISAGATPIPIPLHETPQRVARILASCQGILLPGSPADIDPETYGEKARGSEPPDPARAAVDELLLQDAFNLHKPILAICQGLQALNTWRGGSLIQDLPAEVGTRVDHAPGRAVMEAHPARVTEGTRLAGMLAASRAGVAGGLPEYVNSSHHQAVKRVGDNLAVAAVSPEDGVVEGLELVSEEHFVVGVQWHPERSYDVSGFSRAIFHGFVTAAEGWRPRRVEESVVSA